MKFAKELQQKRLQEWMDQYLDYKLMKKALKVEEDQSAVGMFLRILESQITKVAVFMRDQQQVITQDIRPLECCALGGLTSSASNGDNFPGLVDSHCEHLVRSLSDFQSYVSLNHTAFRKIVKKFDKRFHVSFLQEFSTPMPARTWLNANDIENWMLAPARRCMLLIQSKKSTNPQVSLSCADHEASVRASMLEEGMPKSLLFWVEELRTGAKLAALRVNGRNGAISLFAEAPLVAGGEQIRVKNTFIDDHPDAHLEAENVSRRRCGSLPPVPDEVCRAAFLVEASRALQIKQAAPKSEDAANTTPRAQCDEDKDSPKESPRHDNRPSQDSGDVLSSHSSQQGCFDSEEGSDKSVGDGAEFCANSPSQQTARNRQRVRQASPIRAHSGNNGNAGPSQANRRFAQNRSDQAQCKEKNARWWTDIQDVCPLTGFPIGLLPYPPFKLASCRDLTTNGTIVSTKLVDGLYLALKLLSTWRFEILGRSLSAQDIQALDMYLKRCKLGPASLRVGYAIQLLSEGSHRSLVELDEIRAKATKRLEEVRHIQRVRLARDAPEETSPRRAPQQHDSTRPFLPQHGAGSEGGRCNGRNHKSFGSSEQMAKGIRGSGHRQSAVTPLPVGPVFVGQNYA